MNLSELSIQRPILTWMMTLALIVFGVLGFQRLGVDQFPEMDIPVIGIVTELEGATPEGMEEDVLDPLEESLNSIEGLRSIRSSAYTGRGVIALEFELGTDLDVAAQDAREKADMARYQMTAEIEPPQVGKFDMNQQPILWIPFKTELDPVRASEYVRRELKPQLETIPGVASVEVMGRRDRKIRIWLDGDALHARGLAAGDVAAALAREHVEVPAGRVESQRVEYGVKTDAEFRTLSELEGLIITYQNGAPVHLRDVGSVEDGSEDVRKVHQYNGSPLVGLGIVRQSGSNAVQIVDEVFRRLDRIREQLPAGLTLMPREGFLDFSAGVREAVGETEFTLIFGALLAVLTVFVFLRRARPTLIIAAAIPISLIATFGLVYLAGFTLNTMTLLAMSLAVGVVVDDAIVVLENIERHREAGASAFEAARSGTREITLAATAATFSIVAVFLPVFFVEGIVGSFLGDFGLTVAGSVLISLFVALTLTPMLAARMPPPAPRRPGSIYARLERAFDSLESGYARLLDWSLERRLTTLGMAGASLLAAVAFGSMLESEFFPPQDIGLFYATMESPPGTTVEAGLEYLKRDEAWFLAQPEVVSFFAAVGDGSRGDDAPNHSMLFGSLKPRHQRERNVDELLRDARRELGQVPGRKIRVFNPAQMFQSGGHAEDFNVQLRGHTSLRELDELADRFIAELAKRPGFVDLHKSLSLGMPELVVQPDREKAAAVGVDAREIAEAIQLMIGGRDVGVFQDGTSRVDIRMRLADQYRQDPEAIRRLYVRTRTGDVVELRNLVDIRMAASPSMIQRSNRQRTVEISGNLEDLALGEALDAARAIALEILPPRVHLALEGRADDFMESFRQFGLAIGLGIIVIYMLLAAQFESLVHPFTVMLALPLAMTGALGGLWVGSLFGLPGMTLNLFSLIGIILLFGLVTKNSILLVDYANRLREQGLDKRAAIRRASPVRMRPVLMTALAMIFGVLPAAIGVGPGAESRQPMAIATAAGMFSSTVLTLLFVPVFYLLIDDAGEWIKARVVGSRRPRGSSAPAESPLFSA